MLVTKVEVGICCLCSLSMTFNAFLTMDSESSGVEWCEVLMHPPDDKVTGAICNTSHLFSSDLAQLYLEPQI